MCLFEYVFVCVHVSVVYVVHVVVSGCTKLLFWPSGCVLCCMAFWPMKYTACISCSWTRLWKRRKKPAKALFGIWTPTRPPRRSWVNTCFISSPSECPQDKWSLKRVRSASVLHHRSHSITHRLGCNVIRKITLLILFTDYTHYT